MLVICKKAEKCNSPQCVHKEAHEPYNATYIDKNERCYEVASFCTWANEKVICIPAEEPEHA